MLKVICNQRDRFRARLGETEEVFCSFENIQFWLPILVCKYYIDIVRLEFKFVILLFNCTRKYGI